MNQLPQDPSQANPEDENLVRQMMALGSIPDLQALLRGQGMQGYQEFAGTPSAEGRTVGHTYVASSPWEHMAVALQRGMGALQQQKSKQGLLDTFQQQDSGRTAGMLAALRRLYANQGQAAQPQDQPTGMLDAPQMR